MKPRITLDPDHHSEHDQAHLKNTPPTKTKAVSQKTQQVAAKAHRKAMNK